MGTIEQKTFRMEKVIEEVDGKKVGYLIFSEDEKKRLGKWLNSHLTPREIPVGRETNDEKLWWAAHDNDLEQFPSVDRRWC